MNHQNRLLILFVSLLSSGLTLAQMPPGKTTTVRGTRHTGVTYQQLLAASTNAGNWMTYSGQYNGQRFSRLDQVNDDNAHQLRLKWVRQIQTRTAFETTPLVVDGVMFLTLPENKVWAVDAATGLPYWKYDHGLPGQLAVCCGKVNRGLAILGDTLYMGTLDAKLVALDSKSGNVRWIQTVADSKKGYSITGAPLIVKDMVITGIAGGEYGIRGFLDAYDARTGKRLWRRHTIPGPGEPGHDTWEGDSWKIGGSPTWMTGAFDPALNLLYWGVGNPGPDWNGEVRKGDNLYSDCVLAIDADTGKIKWHFQFTPHDVHDWDACQIPILVDREYGGKQRKLLLWANRNAFYYVLDRETGQFLSATQFAKQTWAAEIDPQGRPIRVPGKLPTKDGVLVWPDVSGAANWHSPTYSPQTGLYYQMAFDGAATYYLDEEAEYVPGKLFLGGFGIPNEYEEFPKSEYVSAVRALDALTGKRIWQYKVQTKSMSGLISTAGNLVFGGAPFGSFFALNAKTGEELWTIDLGGRVHAAPITFMADGKQYITIAAGAALFTFGL